MTRLLTHEWLCGAFLVSLWVRVVWVSGLLDADAMVLLAVMILNGSVLAWCARRESELRWRVRLLFYPVAMNLVYFTLTTAVPKVHPALEDAVLRRADHWLIGTDPSLYLQRWIHPVVTESLSFCYLWYLFYLFSSQIEYWLGRFEVLRRYYTGLFSIYAIGYLGYSMLPALGPYLAMADQYSAPLQGGLFTDLTSKIVLAASNRVDVFPSLHVANSVYMLLFDYRENRWRFWLYLVPCIGLVLATVYLHYHYAIDVLCGLALSLVMLWLVRREKEKRSNQWNLNPRTL